MNSVPTTAKLLGYGGLIPFVGLTLAMIYAGPMEGFWFAWAQTGYGVAIFSFIGAVHWGVALSKPELSQSLRNRAFIWGVIPSLLAVVCLMLPHHWALLALAVLGALALIADVILDRQINMPIGWIKLRIQLTIIACTSLLVSAFVLPAAY